MTNGDSQRRNGFNVPGAIVAVFLTAAMALAGWNLGETEQVARRTETIAARQLDVIQHNAEQDKRIDLIDSEIKDLIRMIYSHTIPDRRPDPPP